MRPRVICHMAASIDGRIVAGAWPDHADVSREYDNIHAEYDSNGWMCGRVTMESFAKAVRSDAEIRSEYGVDKKRDDHTAPGDYDSFAFAIDASGRLAWESNDINGDHVVAVLSERVSDEYLAFLRERGVSYILAGAKDVDLSLALEKIGDRFPVRTLMLEGGGRINGGMLRDGLVDEVSLLVAPVVDGRIGTPALFDIDGENVTAHSLVLEAIERRADDIIWLRYRVEAKR